MGRLERLLGARRRRRTGESTVEERGVAAAIAAFVSLAILAVISLATARPAAAVPSFARQTGQPCAACHTAFPELTPFGRRFKLSGYTLQGGDPKLPPIAAMMTAGFTHTAAPYDSPASTNSQATPPPPGLRRNDNLVMQQVTGIFGGQIYGDLGAFIQLSGDPTNGDVWFDASDVRYVDQFKLFGADTFLGVTVNNTPTVQDVWNTTNAWSFPQLGSTIAPAFTPPGTHIDALAQRVAGAGMYVFWNDMLYAELTAYGGYDKSVLEAFGMAPGPNPDVQRGVMPYWRLAVEPHWGDHYLMLGAFGMYGRTVPQSMFGFGTDDYTDIGFDSQYQYDGDKYSVTLKLSDIIELQRLNASSNPVVGLASNLNDRLNSFKANATFVWDHTYELTGGYFNVSGTTDPTLYGASLTGSPNGSGLIFDAAYLPFSHGSPGPYSTYNARIGVQYVHYLQLYGGGDNFDGSGLGAMHNARGDDTLLLYAWIAF